MKPETPRWLEDTFHQSFDLFTQYRADKYLDEMRWQSEETVPPVHSGRMVVSNPPLQAELKTVNTNRITTAIQPNTLTSQSASGVNGLTLPGGAFSGVRRSDPLILMVLDELVAQLSVPADNPVSDEYEDGYSACLALVAEFADAVRRGDPL